MIPRALPVATALAALVCAGPRATADPGPRAHTVETGVGAGALLPSDDHELYASPTNEFRALSPGPLVSWRASYLPVALAGVEIEIDLIHLTGEGDTATTVVAPRAHAIVQLPRRFAPFAVAGAGLLSSASRELGDDVDPMAYAGIGAKYYWRDRVALRVDARVIRSSRVEDTGGGKGTNHFQLGAGIGWTFGGAAPAAPALHPAARDTDGDGDADDAYPHDAKTVNGIRDDDDDDDDDESPNEADTPDGIDGIEGDDGCADEDDGAPAPVLAWAIRFDVAGHDLDGPSAVALDRVAALLIANPLITRVRIEGHSDDRGTHANNLLLSTRRASQVVDYLVAKGVAAERLDARGFGSARPIATNDTKEGRAQNRRVEIIIDQIRCVPAAPPKAPR